MKSLSSELANRRQAVKKIAKVFLGVNALNYALPVQALKKEAEVARSYFSGPRAKNVIYLYMSGGMSHVDTFDIKQGREVQGPTQAIKTNVTGLYLSEHLPGLAKQMDKLAIINSMFSNQGAHEEGRYFMHSSYTKRGTVVHPGLGSWLVKHNGRNNPNLPGVVHIGNTNPGSTQGFLEQNYAPLLIGDPEAGLQNSRRNKNLSEKEFNDIYALTKQFNQAFAQRYSIDKVNAYSDMYDDALKLMQSKDLDAFTLNREPKKIRDAYGKDAFGQGCLLARRLVERGVRFVEVTLGGWDTHTNNFDRVPENAHILDQAMSTLLVDLNQRGMLEETLVVLTTEFGRTPKINKNEGRDHSPTAFSSVLAGGGIQGGQFYGKSDEDGKFVIENKVTVPDFNATVAYALGLPLDKVEYSPSGRPFRIADKGRAITSLFS